jgi:hypothetical protein
MLFTLFITEEFLRPVLVDFIPVASELIVIEVLNWFNICTPESKFSVSSWNKPE